MLDTKTKLIKELEEQIIGLKLWAESERVVAAHFRPQFEALWVDKKLTDMRAYWHLKTYVIDKEESMKSLLAEAKTLEETVALLKGEQNA